MHCKTAASWPNCSVPSYTFKKLVEPLINVGLLRDMSLIPLLHPPINVQSFEAFAYETFSSDNGYNRTSGISIPFGKGIYAKDSHGSRYHDVTGVTSFSKNKILCPVFAFSDNFLNKNALMFNLHSEIKRGQAIDSVIEAFENGERNATAVTKMLQLVQDVQGPRPACLHLTPISPAENTDTLVGFISIIQNWDTVIGGAIPSDAKGIDFVLSDGQSTYTFTIADNGSVVLKGTGDLHETYFDQYKKTYSPFHNRGYAAYSITYYPNCQYFPHFLYIIPILGCVATMLIILLVSSVFGLYVHHLNRKLRHEHDALESKRSFVRFISHEIRTPLNTVCLGLKLLRDEALGWTETESDIETGKDEEFGENVPSPHSISTATIMQDSKCQASDRTPMESIESSYVGTDSSLITMLSLKPKRRVLKEKVSEWVDLIKDIEESSNNAVDVLNELMSYDKIEMRTLYLEKEILPICALLQSSIKPFYIQAREKNIDLLVHFETDASLIEDDQRDVLKSLVIVGDQIRLMQVFRNLVSNALKFCEPEMSVNIYVCWVPQLVLPDPAVMETLADGDKLESAGGVRITVEDSGPGLSAENMKMLFKEGVQFNANNLQAGGGSGLGLWITKGLVNLHSGTIAAYSPGLGQGASFVVELPAFKYSNTALNIVLLDRKDDPICETSLSSPTTNAEAAEAIAIQNILIVDDAMLSRKMVNRLLSNLGCKCSEACNGYDAVEMMKQGKSTQEQFQLVIMDFEMPVMKGPEAIAELRRLEFKTLIIGVTGNVMQADVDYFMDHGADAVLSKPLSFVVLTDTLRRFNCKSLGDQIL
mmetsp:Transcript_17611/g.24175  ORF Transcript_17611/g.24175 Transcript_17611/m.24175 type:complete len:820 (-) Transcript_17611:228-2687(-)